MREATVVTDRATFRSVARGAEAGTRVPVEVRLEVDDPFDVYRRARDGGDGAFLETTGGQPGWGYFGVDPIERLTIRPEATVAETLVADADPSTDADRPALGRAASGGDSPTLAALQAWLDGTELARGDCDVPYPCGAIGWLSYDVARELESLPNTTTDDRGLPQLQFAAFDRLAAWECPADQPVTLRITACPRVGGSESMVAANVGADEDADVDPERAIDEAYDRGRRRALDLVDRILNGDPAIDAGEPNSAGNVGATDGERSPADVDAATFESDCSPEAFAERVRTIQEHVRMGDTFQTNVSQRLTAPAAVHPVAAYDALRRVNPAPYSALVELPAADLVSASPELLLERRGDRVRTEPIAGTRPRAATEAEDDALERELLTDEKERAEHAMLVDLERNDLGKVCAYGSVDVSEYRRVDRYSEVMHLVSLVEGDLRPDATLADAIAAAFPGGTITGAPKPKTMALIDEVEATRRGPYTGSIGILGFDDRATLNIVIRTLVRHADEYHLRVGAGIVHDSVPEREYAETLDKARALVRAVDEALGERTDLAVEGATADAETDERSDSVATDGRSDTDDRVEDGGETV